MRSSGIMQATSGLYRLCSMAVLRSGVMNCLSFGKFF